MKQIKFRGKSPINGEIYFGGYFKNFADKSFIILENGEMHEVDPESVAQFVGYDVNGFAVYEGDKLTPGGEDEEGDQFYIAALRVNVIDEYGDVCDTCKYGTFGYRLKNNPLAIF